MAGDIKKFVTTFNEELEKEIKKAQETKDDYLKVYNECISLTASRDGLWPEDQSVKTIGDLFKYVFPDPEKDVINEPHPLPGNPKYSPYTADYIDDITGKSSNNPELEKKYKRLKNKSSQRLLERFNTLKKPGYTNPDLYSAGQNWFDIFMYVTTDKKFGKLFEEKSNIFTYENQLNDIGTVSTSVFSREDIPLGPTGSYLTHRGIAADYYEFSQLVLLSAQDVRNITGVDIDLESDFESSAFFGLKTQYKSGLYTELVKDPTFNVERGIYLETQQIATSWKKPLGEFIGNWENILLYKAFLEAGDNYKPVTLPYEKPKPPVDPSLEAGLPEPGVSKDSSFESGDIVFNVEKTDTFVTISGTTSGLEFILVPNDGTSYIFDDGGQTDDLEELDPEYEEVGFSGEEEDPVKLAEAMVLKNDLQSDIPANTPPSNFTVDETNINYNDPSFSGPQWKSFNIDNAVAAINKTSHKPSKQFTESLKTVLYFIKQDPEIKDLREAAYLLGTAYAESGYSLQRWEADYACGSTGVKYGPNGPCSSALNYYKSTKGGKRNYYDLGTDKSGFPYFGRGLIQLTGKDNYEKYGKLIGVDLLSNGDLAMKPENSYKVTSIYMRGRTFKHVLAGNLTQARKSVNGGTKGLNEVNGAYNDWLNVLKQSVAA